ncbi:quaternary ammonium compound-resistance protein SugE [Alginatibacterium sediminis]|uniref:Guanidinium exporter n=1 Tax=Alginatibacterium sediminis TaxID=2164068 RepID=A0A420EDP6_9ALTE|nr:quaternary ammonium compound efflux SMR transporter SugE [Alginatibacterium sediminis]RKF18752.1 quaternary ammonium compound-resistance protein SugE [Alginatibacterium sediminis]
MAWIVLFFAGLFEIAWAIGLKYTQGFTQFWPSVATLSCLIVSFVLLGLSMNSLPVGTAYAVWVGIGTIGTVILGVVMFNEPANLVRMLSLSFIVLGIVGLKISS